MRVIWTHPLPAPPVGLSLAYEGGSLLLWDAEPALARYGPLGQRDLRQRAHPDCLAATLSDDGRTVAAVGKKGQVWLLTADLVPIWERTLPRRPAALALDHLGGRLAVADDAGGLHLFDRAGKVRWQVTAPRPLVRLAFVPEVGALVGTAELGLVCAFDGAGRIAWRDGLAAHIADLAVSGDGGRIVLACFTGGLCTYALGKPGRDLTADAGPAKLAALSYPGDVLVTADLERTLSLRRPGTKIAATLALPSAPVALAVEALGEGAVCALANGQLVRVEWGGGEKS